MKYEQFLAASLLAVPLYAGAQSVTLYGVVDTGVEYVNNVGANKYGVVRVPTLTGTVPSRWGIRGTEDLGQGLKAFFWLEGGFAPDSGVQGQGRLFGRQSAVGLSSQWGDLSFGRQYTMLYWAVGDSGILFPNIHGIGTLDPYLPNARTDNSIAYKGKFGGLTVGATYSFGRDTVNNGPSPSGTNCAGENPADKNACREWSAMLMYTTNTWGIGTAYDSQRGGPGAFAGLTSSGLKDDRYTITAYVYPLSNVKVGTGWLYRNNEASATARSDTFWLGAVYDITPQITLNTALFYQKFRSSSNQAWLGAFRADYNFSKRTMAYLSVGYVGNGGQLATSISGGAAGSNPMPGGNQLGTMLGIKHTF